MPEIPSGAVAERSESTDGHPARPLGARLTIDPWSGNVELRRTPAVAIAGPREKAPLTITAFMPYIESASAATRSAAAQPSSKDSAP